MDADRRYEILKEAGYNGHFTYLVSDSKATFAMVPVGERSAEAVGQEAHISYRALYRSERGEERVIRLFLMPDMPEKRAIKVASQAERPTFLLKRAGTFSFFQVDGPSSARLLHRDTEYHRKTFSQWFNWCVNPEPASFAFVNLREYERRGLSGLWYGLDVLHPLQCYCVLMDENQQQEFFSSYGPKSYTIGTWEWAKAIVAKGKVVEHRSERCGRNGRIQVRHAAPNADFDYETRWIGDEIQDATEPWASSGIFKSESEATDWRVAEPFSTGVDSR